MAYFKKQKTQINKACYFNKDGDFYYSKKNSNKRKELKVYKSRVLDTNFSPKNKIFS